jgi:membrane protease YdiL (CAAX protease family)
MFPSKSALIEPLILYLVLFLPGVISPSPAPELIIFSAERELIRILLYNIPSLVLIGYLLLQKKSLRAWGIRLPGKRDFHAALFAFPGLLLLGLGVSLVSPFFTDAAAVSGIASPAGPLGWLVMLLSCLSTGYLEEGFFRFYLISKLGEAGIKNGTLVFVSTLLFSVCHIYEGPWGMLNAVLAGTFLSLIFLHFRSLHGIALAHGLYNAFVYALGV